MGSAGREEENLAKETSPAEITWCLKNPKAQAVPSVLPVCQGQGAIPAMLRQAPALPALLSAGPSRQKAPNANVGKVILAEERQPERNTRTLVQATALLFQKNTFLTKQSTFYLGQSSAMYFATSL